MIGGVDNDGAQLFVTEPSGVYFQYKATAIGEHDSEIKDKLRDRYKENKSTKDNVKLAVEILKEIKKEDFKLELLDVAVIDVKTRIYKVVDIKTLVEK